MNAQTNLQRIIELPGHMAACQQSHVTRNAEVNSEGTLSFVSFSLFPFLYVFIFYHDSHGGCFVSKSADCTRSRPLRL